MQDESIDDLFKALKKSKVAKDPLGVGISKSIKNPQRIKVIDALGARANESRDESKLYTEEGYRIYSIKDIVSQAGGGISKRTSFIFRFERLPV